MDGNPKLLTSRYDTPRSWELEVASKLGAYRVARQALNTLAPEELKAGSKGRQSPRARRRRFPYGHQVGFCKPQAW